MRQPEPDPYFEAALPLIEGGHERARADLPEEPHPASGPGGEPPRPPRRMRKPAVLAVVVGTVIAGITVGLTRSSGTTAAIRQLKPLYGQVVAETAGGMVAVTPAGGGTSRYSLPGAGQRFDPVAVSTDGTTWLSSGGAVVTLDGTLRRATSTTPGGLTSNTTTPAPVPFADQRKAIVVLNRPTDASPAEASVVGVADTRRADLGLVDSAGGDPQSFGAFVSVPADLRQFRTAHATAPDVDVELRRAGQPAAVLATAAQLNADVGWLPSRPVQLEVYPNPTGESVAVMLTPLDPVNGDVPMVVLNRAGGVLAAITEWSGPISGTEPVWSTGSHQLAYPTYTPSGPALAIATETGTVGTVAAPGAGTQFGRCIWSPSSTDVICMSRTAGRYQWLYAVPTDDRLIPRPSIGVPVAWIAGPP